MYSNCGLSFRSSFAEGFIDIDWSISEKFGVWYNDWNLLWKQVKTISLQKLSPQYQPKWTNWSFKWWFAAFLVKVGYCSNILTNLEWGSLLCALRATLRYEVIYHWKSLRTWEPRKIINHCKSENYNDQKDNYKRSYWQMNKILFEQRMKLIRCNITVL